MDFSMLGVPQARGVGHKAISGWLLASRLSVPITLP